MVTRETDKLRRGYFQRFLWLSVISYFMAFATKNIKFFLYIAIILGILSKLVGYYILFYDYKNGLAVHTVDVFFSYINHFLIFNSLYNLLMEYDANSYHNENPDDKWLDSIYHTFIFSTLIGSGDIVAKTNPAKWVSIFQAVDAYFLSLTFGTYLIRAAVE